MALLKENHGKKHYEVDMFVSTNINYHIRFKPSEKAKEIYKDRLSNLLGKAMPEFSRELQVSDDGWAKMQMWYFFQVFGQYFGMGRECIISTEVEIEIKEAQ